MKGEGIKEHEIKMYKIYCFTKVTTDEKINARIKALKNERRIVPPNILEHVMFFCTYHNCQQPRTDLVFFLTSICSFISVVLRGTWLFRQKLSLPPLCVHEFRLVQELELP